MTISTEQHELTEIITSICTYIAQMVKGVDGAELRRQIGLVRVNGLQYLADKTFSTNLYNCFVTARKAPITADTVALVRYQIQQLTPTEMIAILVVESAIVYCLTSECLLITQMEFKSRDDVQNMMARMTTAFNAARDQAADRMDSLTYENLTALAGSIINHLNTSSLTLPRIVNFHYQKNWPALRMAHLIYQDTSRWDELVDENQVVHPLFMPRDVVGLSA
jgi:prophage DNA circulation protein